MRILIFLFMSMALAIFLSSTVKADQKACLAEAVYFESRSESFIAQLAVANVVLNRVASKYYPNNICDVVHQSKTYDGHPIRNKCMFSYWCDGKPERINDIKAYKVATNVADLALSGVVVEHVMDATHYHAHYVTPHWATAPSFETLTQIGSHIFYVDMRN